MYTTQNNNEEFVVLPKLLIDSVMSHVAGFEYVTDERKGYFLCMAIKTVHQHEKIRNILKKKYAENYPKVIQKFNYYFQLMSRVKGYKDIIETDEKIRSNIHHPYQKELNKIMAQIPMIYTVIFDIFLTIIQHTNLGAYTPTTQQIRQYQLAYKKVTYKLTDKQLGFQQTRPNESPTGERNVY